MTKLENVSKQKKQQEEKATSNAIPNTDPGSLIRETAAVRTKEGKNLKRRKKRK